MGSRLGQRGQLLIGDPALRTDHQQHRFRTGDTCFSERDGGRFVQHQGQRPRHPGHQLGGGHQALHLGDVRATGLPGRRPGDRLPAPQPLVALGRGLPARHAPVGLPGQEGIRPGLGGQFDRELGALRFGQGLRDGDGRRRAGHRLDRQHPGRQPALDRLLHHDMRQGSGAVAEVEFLPDPGPPDGGGVMPLVTVDDGGAAHAGQRIDVEQTSHARSRRASRWAIGN